MKVLLTLLMMQSAINNSGALFSMYNNVASSTKSLLDASIPIAAGTDNNDNIYVPANPPFGSSLHKELAIMVAVGFTPSQALQAATSAKDASFYWKTYIIQTGF
ncbi:hypothetical protein BKA65DRAFT_569221 [Rhexocercosporidium sp. MPI-PUGE-AT-0058]|nr:hypothetical protein BKA65DRAFT_569221 [Rhexocercosporidium sp. MPI-PUGE-AT-0058]